MAITFEQAIVKMMEAYWDDLDDFKNSASNKDRKYTKKFFDGLDEQMNGPKETKNKKTPGPQEDKKRSSFMEGNL